MTDRIQQALERAKKNNFLTPRGTEVALAVIEQAYRFTDGRDESDALSAAEEKLIARLHAFADAVLGSKP